MNIMLAQLFRKFFATNQRLSVLVYHRVLSRPDPLFPYAEDAAMFSWHMEAVSSIFNVIPFHEAVTRLQKNSLPPRALCITFDDGYADNHDVALPILQKFGLPATFFVTTGFLDGGRMWNDSIIETVRNVPGPFIDLENLGLGVQKVDTIEQKQRLIAVILHALKYLSAEERVDKVESLMEICGVVLPDNLMMTTEQVRSLAHSGMEIGAHTVSHPILACLDASDAKEEIEECKTVLEDMLGMPVSSFAYPNGKPGEDYHAEHVRMVKRAGYSQAASTAWGASSSASNVFQIPRFTPWDQTQPRFLLRLLRNLRNVDTDAV